MKRPVDLQVPAPITASPLWADIDQDGAMELVVMADRVYAWRLPGLTPLAGYPKWMGGPSASTPVLVHPQGGRPVMLFGSDDDRLYGMDAAGTLLPGFPVSTGGDIFTTPLTAELEGGLKVIFGSDDGRLYSLGMGRDGSAQPETLTSFGSGGFVSSTPALLPRPGSSPDLVFGSWDGYLYCLRPGDPLSCCWKTDTGHLIWSSPVVCDLDGDGRPEVVVLNDRLHVLDSEGNPLPPFPVRLAGMAVGAPAIGDLGGEGDMTIVAAADRLYAWRLDGSQLPGFPVDTGAPFWASPILADIDGDGRDEIVAGDYAGRLLAVDRYGRYLPGFPEQLGSCLVSSPIAADLDGDSLLELVACSFDGHVAVRPTLGRSSQWPGFRGPLGNGVQPAAGRPVRLPSVRTSQKGDPEMPALRVIRRRIRRRNYAGQILYELEMELEGAAQFRKGLLHFERGGAWYPSPVLRNGSRVVARFPPYRRLRRVRWYVTLERAGGGTLRLPERDAFSFVTW